MLTGAYAASYASSFHLNALCLQQVDYFIVLYLSFDWLLLGLDDSQHTSSLQSFSLTATADLVSYSRHPYMANFIIVFQLFPFSQTL